MENRRPYSYFLDEVRDGFFIPGMMKRVWAVCLDDCATIESFVREKLGGEVYASFGTMIGAVRGCGFIPWDDDLDLCIIRDVYDRLKKISDEDGLPGDYKIHDYEMDGGDNEARKLHDRRTRIVESARWGESHGYPFDNNIDLFLLDYIPENEDKKKEFMDVATMYAYLKTISQEKGRRDQGEAIDETISIDKKKFDECKKTVEGLSGVYIGRYSEKPEYMRYMLACDEYCARQSESESDEMICVPLYLRYGTQRYPKRYFDSVIEVEFEQRKLRMSVAYDEMLRRAYGDYMRPVHIFSGHEYPCFEEYERDLKDIFGLELFKYHIDPEKISSDLSDRPGRQLGEKWSVAFLPYKSEYWNSLHSVWEELTGRDDVDVSVIPIPYFYRGFEGEIIGDDIQLELTGYPDEVDLIRFDELDISDWHPDVIVFQFPYDEYCDTMDVLPFFHASNLVHYTDHLVFIPPFTLREIVPEDERAKKMIRRYLRTPGMIYADRIFVQSEMMRDVWTELIGEFISEELSGEVIDNSSKIIGTGSPIFDQYEKKDTERKKKILIHLSGSRIYCKGEEILKKFEEVISFLSGYKDRIDFGILCDRYADSILGDSEPELLKKYEMLISSVAEYGGTIYRSEDEDVAVREADAFYGDGCVAMNRCRILLKPVMMEELGCPLIADDKYEKKTWNPEMTVETEGEWCLENFIEEVLRYEPDPSFGKSGSGHRIIMEIESLKEV